LDPQARLSEQQADVLVGFERAKAGKAILLITLDDTLVVYLDGEPQSDYVPREARFLETDLNDLCALGLLSTSRNKKGDALFSLTRPGHELARQLLTTMTE
jgi:hypothetical protein